MNVLITFGGTKEPIDSVRHIGNNSSGKTGAVIAENFVKNNATVTCLKAKGIADIANANNIDYYTFEDLQSVLLEEISSNHYDIVIHAAAVSDYRVSEVINDSSETASVGGKIRSGQQLKLVLEPTPKLIDKIKDSSKNKNIILVGFKLTESANMQEKVDAVSKIFNSGARIVVQNDLTDINTEKHICQIFLNPQEKVITNTKNELAEKLYIIAKELT